MGLFNKKKTGGVSDIIRCDLPSYLIWKWHPEDAKAGVGERENSIRCGSRLRVKDGEVAVFVYKQKNGVMQDYIEGPFDETLSTKNLPVLSSLAGLLFDGSSPFMAEVYFINLSHVVQVKFGVPYFDVADKAAPGFSVPVAVRGAVSFRIQDYKKFIKCHRLVTFSLEDFKEEIKHAICRYARSAVLNQLASGATSLLEIEGRSDSVSLDIEVEVMNRFDEDFGVRVTRVDVNAIDIDKSSEGYLNLKRVMQEDYEESARIRREEEQYARHKATESANLEAYKTEKAAEVGVAGANALAEMGANGAGNVGGGDFNPAAIMTNIALGGVVAENVVGAMRGNSGNAGNPPPIPESQYFIAVNGQANGPYGISALTQMALNGTFNGDTLVWQQGMPAWLRASSVPELQAMLAGLPPIIPPTP